MVFCTEIHAFRTGRGFCGAQATFSQRSLRKSLQCYMGPKNCWMEFLRTTDILTSPDTGSGPFISMCRVTLIMSPFWFIRNDWLDQKITGLVPIPLTNAAWTLYGSRNVSLASCCLDYIGC